MLSIFLSPSLYLFLSLSHPLTHTLAPAHPHPHTCAHPHPSFSRTGGVPPRCLRRGRGGCDATPRPEHNRTNPNPISYPNPSPNPGPGPSPSPSPSPNQVRRLASTRARLQRFCRRMPQRSAGPTAASWCRPISYWGGEVEAETVGRSRGEMSCSLCRLAVAPR